MVAILNQKIPVFQSTLPREERLFGFGIRVIISIFQSTLPREERHTSRFISLLLTLYFNPRSHERSDRYVDEFINRKICISIHAPTRGATIVFPEFFDFASHFNPRSHERSDSNIAQKICLFLYNTDNKYIIR